MNIGEWKAKVRKLIESGSLTPEQWEEILHAVLLVDESYGLPLLHELVGE